MLNPEPILEIENAKLHQDLTVITDPRIEASRPDIVLLDKSNNTVKLIDIVIPADHNILHTSVTKIPKYHQELAIEIQDMGHVEAAETTHIIISTNGVMHSTFFSNAKKIDLTMSLVRP